MRFFKRKSGVIDLSEKYKRQQEQVARMKKEMQEASSEEENSSKGFLSFLGNMASSNTSKDKESVESENTDTLGSEIERKRKLAKRLKDMTERIEDISNQIYHIQQRLELIEKKMNLSRYE